MKKALSYLWSHKIILLVILVMFAVAVYFGYQKTSKDSGEVSYITSTVEKGMIISSISGSGQVSALNQVDINPKVSGDIVAVKVQGGQEVKEGDLIAQIDSRDAVRKVSEARSSLENAKLDLEELLAPVDAYTLLQAENSLADAEDSLVKLITTQENNYQNTLEDKQKAEDNLEKSHEDAYNDMADAFLDFPTIMTGLETVLFSDEIADSEPAVGSNSNDSALINSVSDSLEQIKFEGYVATAKNHYEEAESHYDDNFEEYKDTNRYSSKNVIENLLEQTIETAKRIADAVKSETNMLDYWVNYRTDKGLKIYSKVSTYQSNFSSYTSKIGSHLSSLLATSRSIEDYKEAIAGAERDLAEMEQNNPINLEAAERSLGEKKEKLADLKSGATELEIKNKQLAVQQKENSLIDAQQDYADYFIRASFDGTIAEVTVAKGDSVSSGTAVATLITNQKIAEITLNEIEAAQVEVGQKTTLEFDAIEALSITGEVAEVDVIGTVSQGVVSYDIKIIFDLQDTRVKPGMSISATIITDSKQNVLLIPNSALKTQGSFNYVEILTNGQPEKKTVSVGISSDTMVEITEGLEEGEGVITQTTSTAASQSGSTSQGGRSGGEMMGGMMRMAR